MFGKLVDPLCYKNLVTSQRKPCYEVNFPETAVFVYSCWVFQFFGGHVIFASVASISLGLTLDGAVAIVTALGKTLSKIPVAPRFAKMITQASKEDGCLQYMIAIVAALTVKVRE